MGIDGVLGSPLLFVLVVLPLRCCFEFLHSPRVPTLGKSPFSPHEGFWCRRSTALSSSWVSNLGESTVKETNRSFDRSRSKFADPRYQPRGRITKSVTVTTAYNRTILSGTAASAQYKMAKAALHLKTHSLPTIYRFYCSKNSNQSLLRTWAWLPPTANSLTLDDFNTSPSTNTNRLLKDQSNPRKRGNFKGFIPLPRPIYLERNGEAA